MYKKDKLILQNLNLISKSNKSITGYWGNAHFTFSNGELKLDTPGKLKGRLIDNIEIPSSIIQTIIIDSNVTAPQDSSYLFSDCNVLKEIYGLQHLNISNVKDISYFFFNDYELYKIDSTFPHTNMINDKNSYNNYMWINNYINRIRNFDITTATPQSYSNKKYFETDEESLDGLFSGPQDYLNNIKKGIIRNKKLLNNLNTNDSDAILKISNILINDNKIKKNMYSILSYIIAQTYDEGLLDYIQSNKQLLNKKDKRGTKELLIKFSNSLSHNYYNDAKEFQNAKDDKDNEIKFNKDKNRYDDIKHDPTFKSMINGYIYTMNKILINLDK